jgi:hypothetical protein
MALLSLDMIREIQGVADAYTARERERLGVATAIRTEQSRRQQPRRDGNADKNR